MNILLLTPDAVGGTLLNRLITIYSQFHEFDKPVIGLNDLADGLNSFYSQEFNRMILKSSPVDDENQGQSLEKIVDLLRQSDHYVVAKLTHYMMDRRQDLLDKRINFYNYLNNNFLIISCRRNNVFEHALSWSINKITNSLNVYSIEKKIDDFFNYFSNGLKIDPLSLLQSLKSYKRYIDWTENNFSIAYYYHYENDSKDIENFILNLPMFNKQTKKVKWEDNYGISFNEWNRHHYLGGYLGALEKTEVDSLNPRKNKINYEHLLTKSQDEMNNFLIKYNEVKGSDWPDINSLDDFYSLPMWIQNECKQMNITHQLDELEIIKNSIEGKYDTTLNSQHQEIKEATQIIQKPHDNFLSLTRKDYKLAIESIEIMKNIGIIQNTVPIKKHTLAEKMKYIDNIDECLQTYNKWAVDNQDICSPMTIETLENLAYSDQSTWIGFKNSK